MSVVIVVDSRDGNGLLEGLEAELTRRGAAVEILAPGKQPGLAADSIPSAAALLARHGVIVLALAPLGACPADVLKVTEAELLSAECRQAFIRRLELSGFLPAGPEDVSDDEEAIIRERLQKLGYL